VFKLVCVMLVSLPVCMGMVHVARQHSLGMVAAVAVAGMLMLTVESYFVFGLRDVWVEFEQRMRLRARPA
jgi:hypothetical protein